MRLMMVCLCLLGALPVQSQSLLWQVSGNGLAAPSYVYGTIHIKDSRVIRCGNELVDTLVRCTTFVSEIDLAPASLMRASKLMLLPGDSTLHDVFSEADYEMIRKEVQSCSGLPLAAFNRFKPVALIALCFSEDPAGKMKQTVDEWLYSRAVANGMEVTALETIEEQVSLMDRIPPAYVVDFFSNLAEQQQEIEEMIRAYVQADLDHLAALVIDETSGALLNDEMVRVRNYRMAGRMVALMQKQSAFVAIGSGHLPGEEGVLALLTAQGYRVEPVILHCME